MNKTKLEWCDFTVNPVKYRDGDGKSVWACVKVSDGCKSCYAESLAKRYGRGGPYTVGQTATVTPYLDEAELRQMLSVKRLPPGSRVFVGDMTDIFGEWVPDEMLDRMFAVFALRPDVVFQVLTKRPERMRAYMSWRDEERGLVRQGAVQYVLDVQHARGEWKLDNSEWPKGRPQLAERWPLPNVWLGTSVEDQAAADKRIPELLATPAAVRFLSCEPLLGDVFIEAIEMCGPVYGGFPGGDPRNFTPDRECCTPAEIAAWEAACAAWDRGEGEDRGPSCATFGDGSTWTGAGFGVGTYMVNPPIDWVIVGGESGPGARPMDVAWARSLVSQCRSAGVAVFVKQLGAKPYRQGFHIDPVGDTEPYTQMFNLRDRKGGDMSEWPADLRVRQFPEVAR